MSSLLKQVLASPLPGCSPQHCTCAPYQPPSRPLRSLPPTAAAAAGNAGPGPRPLLPAAAGSPGWPRRPLLAAAGSPGWPPHCSAVPRCGQGWRLLLAPAGAQAEGRPGTAGGRAMSGRCLAARRRQAPAPPALNIERQSQRPAGRRRWEARARAPAGAGAGRQASAAAALLPAPHPATSCRLRLDAQLALRG